jgi:predicted signal transduction protein with EAL and GGDEF domain
MTAPVPVEVTLTPITLRGEVILHTLWRDISERRLTETACACWRRCSRHSAEAIMVSDRDNRIVEVNGLLSPHRLPPTRCAASDPRLLSSGASAPEEYRAMWQAISQQRPLAGRNLGSPQGRHGVSEMALDLDDSRADGNVEHYIGSFVDISERKAAEEKISHLAHFDTLTDLPNRSNLQGRLEQALASARREGHCPLVAVMFLDLDRFKNINDTLGHHVGDALLLEVSHA